MALRTLLVSLVLCAVPALGWWDFWPYLEHQDMLDRSIDIAMTRYPDMAAEIDAHRDEMLEGAHDEDFDEDQTNGSYADYSAYCPAVPGAYWPIARRHLNAIQWVHDPLNPNNWEDAVVTYGSSRSSAYYMLGRVMHNVQDLLVPAHSNVAPHGLGTGDLVENHSWPAYFDNFEQWCEVGDNELNRARADRIPELELDSLMRTGAAFSSTDVESAGFFPSQYYAVPDAPGGWGRYRPYPSGGYPCGNDRIDNDLANAWSLWLVPRCCEIGAGAIRAFWLACNPTAVEEEHPATRARLRLRSPAKPGWLLCAAGGTTRAEFISPGGRVRAVRTGGSIRCPDLAPGAWFVRLERAGSTSCHRLVVTR